MNADSYTKVVLSVILLCSVLLVARVFAGDWRGEEAARNGEVGEAGRYRVQLVKLRRGQAILRHDTATGQLWVMKNFLAPGAHWSVLGEEPPEGEESAGGGEGEATAPPAASPEEGEAREVSDLETILGTLRRSVPMTRIWAAAQISHGHFPASVAVPALIDALDAEEPEVVIAVVKGLGRMKDPSALPALREMLSHPDPGVVSNVREAIAQIESAS